MASGAPLKGKTVVVAGASRGVGLGLVHQFLNRENNVIATARQVDKAAELRALSQRFPDQLHLTTLDVSRHDSITSWAAGLKSQAGIQHVDVLVNNAGIYPPAMQLRDSTPDDFLQTFQTNAMGPFFITQQLWLQGLLGGAQPSIVINMSSIIASHGDLAVSSTLGGRYAYRCSKAALNAINKALAMDLGPQGVDCVLIHPGYVKTDMNDGNGWIDVEQSTSAILTLLEDGRPLNGRFYAYDGEEIPW